MPAIAGGTDLSNEEIARYSRHLIMPEVTIEGQKRLKESSVLLIGAGGLGSPASLYLAAAGVGRIGIVDFDVVDESNLQRQIVHDTTWVGKPKLDSAKARLSALNPHIEIETYAAALTSENALVIMKDYDVVVDGTDNFETRYLTNDACYFLKKPNVYGSIFRFEGQASGLLARPRAVLPLPLPGAAAARDGAELRRGRRPGGSARCHRRDPGHRGDQDPPGHWRASRRPPAPVRRSQP